MDKVMHALTSGAVALFLVTGIAVAAGQTRPDEEGEPLASEDPPGGPPSVTTGTEKEKRIEEYTATLKKCDSIKASEKQKCVEAANRKFGYM